VLVRDRGLNVDPVGEACHDESFKKRNRGVMGRRTGIQESSLAIVRGLVSIQADVDAVDAAKESQNGFRAFHSAIGGDAGLERKGCGFERVEERMCSRYVEEGFSADKMGMDTARLRPFRSVALQKTGEMFGIGAVFAGAIEAMEDAAMTASEIAAPGVDEGQRERGHGGGKCTADRVIFLVLEEESVLEFFFRRVRGQDDTGKGLKQHIAFRPRYSEDMAPEFMV